MLKWGLRELLREREKGVLRATRPRTPFQGEYPPPGNLRQYQYRHYIFHIYQSFLFTHFNNFGFIFVYSLWVKPLHILQLFFFLFFTSFAHTNHYGLIIYKRHLQY